jgi:two-component system capsular synthesis response regulator RcsB
MHKKEVVIRNPTRSPMRLAITDSHPSALLGIRTVLEEMDECEIVGTMGGSSDIIVFLEQCACDLLIISYGATEEVMLRDVELDIIRRIHPNLKIVVLTSKEEINSITHLKKKGVHCIVSKADNPENLVFAVRIAYAGGAYLSPTIATISCAPSLTESERVAGFMQPIDQF